MSLRFAGLTDAGAARERNEDAFELRPGSAWCLVADGMGGHQSGIVASRMAVEEIVEHYERLVAENDGDPSTREEIDRLEESVRIANERIFNAAATNAKLKGMGTTVVAASFHGVDAHIAHVGDSRAYRLRDGDLVQLTADHSMLNEYLKAGFLTPAEAERFPYRHVITRAVGVAENVNVEVNVHPSQAGDVYLLCSDGLTDMLSDEQITDIVNRDAEDLDDTCRRLVAAANDNGGRDNITVVLVKVEPD